MTRHAFVLRVNPGRVADYIANHNPVPADLADEIRAAGIRNYSIFLDEETHLLFGYFEGPDDALARVATTEAIARFGELMEGVMDLSVQRTPREVFHLE